MKWSVQQLRKINKFPYSFEETLEFDITGFENLDIIQVLPVNITGEIYMIDEDTFRFVYHVHAPLVLECSLTLDPVEYILDNDYDEVYSTVPSDDVFSIEKNTVDTSIMVWTNILLDKPLNYSKPDAYEILKERGIVLDEQIELDENDPIISYSDGLENDSDDESEEN